MKIFADAQTVRTQIEGFRGLPGRDGRDGARGRDGKDGYTPVKGVDYFDGKDGADGVPGKDGAPGYTPKRGTDYWTEADRQEIVDEVLAQMPETGGNAGNSGAWSLIINQRIAEDCIMADFYTGDNGEVLSEYDDIIIFLELAANAGEFTSGVAISFTKSKTPWSAGYKFKISAKKLSEFTGRNFELARFEKTGAGVVPIQSYHQLNTSNVAQTLYMGLGSNTGNVNFNTPFTVDGPDALEYETISMAAEFEAIRIGGYQAVIGAGSVIKAWGHKA